MNITQYEQRGTLIHFVPTTYQFKIVTGWFHVQGNTVVRRKIGGRNTYNFCQLENVDSFTTEATPS